MKSFACGPQGRVFSRVSVFDRVFNNVKTEKKQSPKSDSIMNDDCNFCSCMMFSSYQGRLMCARLYLFDCESAKGKLSVFKGLNLGDFDGDLWTGPQHYIWKIFYLKTNLHLSTQSKTPKKMSSQFFGRLFSRSDCSRRYPKNFSTKLIFRRLLSDMVEATDFYI